MTGWNGVAIYAQVANGRVTSTTQELLGIGRQLATALGEDLEAVVPGSGAGALAQEMIDLGADRVSVLDGPFHEGYNSDLHLAAMEAWCKEAKPNILLFGHDRLGRDLAPRLACRLRTGLMPDSLELSIAPDTQGLVCTRPLYGGNIMAVVACPTRPQLATVRLKSQKPAERQPGRQGQVSTVPVMVEPHALRTIVVEMMAEEASGDVKLEDAEVIVSGGRGIGGTEGFKVISELAQLLSGAVGASRSAVDAGWMGSERQVGLTGKIVSPKLYVAVGISGTIQHMAGCSGSKTIVAINTDPEAPIFKAAHFGIVGDYRKVVPAMIAALRAG